MSKPKSLKKKVLIGLAALVGLMVVAAIALPIVVDPNVYRPKIEEMAERQLGREVQLGELGLSVFPSIAVTVDGLSVADENGGELIAAEQVRLSAALGPLLSKRLEISRVTVEKPRATVRRLADGSFELARLLGAGEDKPAGESRVSLAALRIRDGQVVFEDASVRPGQVVRHELSELQLELDGLDRLEKPLDLKLSARLPSISADSRVAWTGKLSRDLALDGKLELAAVELAAFADHATALGGRDFSKLAGRLDAALDLERDPKGGLAIAGDVDARGLVVPREDAPVLSLPDFVLGLGLDARTEGRVAVDRFSLETGRTKLNATGSMESEGDERRLVLDMPVTKLDVADLRTFVKRLGAPVPLDGLKGESVRAGAKLRAVASMTGGFELKRLDLDGLTLEGLKLGLVRRQDGRFDFQDAPKSAGSKSKSQSGVQVAARNVRLSGIDLRFEDRAVGSETVVTQVKDLELTVEKWLPGKTTPIRLAGKLAGGRASLDGSVGPISGEDLPVDLQAKLTGIDVAAVAPYLSHYGGLNAEKGRLELDSRIRGSKAKEIALAGRLALESARVQLPGREPLSLDLTIDHDLSLEKGGDRVRIRQVTLGLPGGPVAFDGTIDLPEGGQPSFDVGTRGAQRLTTDDLRYLIGLFGAETGVSLDAGEPLELDARLKKRADDYQVQGSARLRKLLVRHALLGDDTLRVAKADVSLRGEEVKLEDLLLQLGGSDLSGWLSFRGFDRHRVDFDLSSQRADLDELFAFAGRGESDAGPKSGDGSTALSRTTADGRLRVQSATLKELELTNFDAKVSLADGRLGVKPATLGLYGGTTRVDLGAMVAQAPVSYDASATLKGVDVKALLAAGVGYENLSGIADGTVKLAGSTGSPEQSVRSAAGSGKLALSDGRIVGLNMVKLLQTANFLGERSLSELAERIGREGTSFERLDADYTLRDGVLHLDRVSTQTPDLSLSGKGPVGLLDQTLKLDLVILFNKELSAIMKEEGSLASQVFWSRRDNAVRVPLRVSGTLSNPKGTPNMDIAKQLGLGAVEDILSDVLTGGGKDGEGKDGDVLGSVLGGLLGRGQKEPASEPPTRQPEPTREEPASGGGDAPSFDLKTVRIGGKIFRPDLVVEGTIRGVDLAGATVVVRDEAGNEIHRDEQAFASQVDEHYAAGTSRSSSTQLAVSWRLRGKGDPGMVVSVTPRSRSGAKGQTVTKSAKAKLPF